VRLVCYLIINLFIVFHTHGISWSSKMIGFVTTCLTSLLSLFRSFRSVCLHSFGLCYFPVSRDKLYASSRYVVSISVTDCTTDNTCCPSANSSSFCYDKRDLCKNIFISYCFYIILWISDTSELFKYPAIGRLMPNQEDFSNFQTYWHGIMKNLISEPGISTELNVVDIISMM
jgi:hypothetical protein